MALKAHFDGLDLAETSLAHERARLLELDGRTLLRAEQELAVRLLDRVGEETPLADREGGGLLHIDVLAGERGLDRNLRVPVVGRGDRDDVDVRARDEVVEVARAHDGVGGSLVVARKTAGVKVARRDDPRAVGLHESGGVHRAPDASASDLRHVERVARRVRAQYPRGDDGRKGQRRPCRRRAMHEAASAHFHIVQHSFLWVFATSLPKRSRSAQQHQQSEL